MSTMDKALKEFDILAAQIPDAVALDFKDEILALLRKFADSGQSGSSAPFVRAAIVHTIDKLCMQEPLTPIYNVPEEWSDESNASQRPLFQNVRCSSLFKEADGQVYNISAIVFVTPKDIAYTGSTVFPDGRRLLSRAKVKSFPFTPKTFYVHVREEEISPDDWDFYIDDVSQLEAIKEVYDLVILDE